jgi:hypothetical protein
MIYAIGSDPEFVFVDNKGALIPAYNILHSRSALQDTIGLDAHSSTAELRPMYSTSIYEHLNNIVRAKAQIQNICNMFSVNAIARPLFRSESLGGHIHISVKSREDYTRKLSDNGIILQFLALPAAQYLFKDMLYKRFAKSNFRYGSPYDIRSDWGKNHIELRMFPTFLGLNNSNINALLKYYITGFVYLEHHKIKIPDIKTLANTPLVARMPISFGFPSMSERDFNKLVKAMRDFVYSEKLGFAINLYKSLNTANNGFYIAKYGAVVSNDIQYAGVVQWLSLRTRKHIIISHSSSSNTPRYVVKGQTHYVYLNTRVTNANYLSISAALANKILKEIK